MDENTGHAPLAATLTITNSSHPEFLYFVDVRVGGRQISRRFNNEDDVREFAMRVVAEAAARNILVEIRDER